MRIKKHQSFHPLMSIYFLMGSIFASNSQNQKISNCNTNLSRSEHLVPCLSFEHFKNIPFGGLKPFSSIQSDTKPANSKNKSANNRLSVSSSVSHSSQYENPFLERNQMSSILNPSGKKRKTHYEEVERIAQAKLPSKYRLFTLSQPYVGRAYPLDLSKTSSLVFEDDKSENCTHRECHSSSFKEYKSQETANIRENAPSNLSSLHQTNSLDMQQPYAAPSSSQNPHTENQQELDSEIEKLQFTPKRSSRLRSQNATDDSKPFFPRRIDFTPHENFQTVNQEKEVLKVDIQSDAEKNRTIVLNFLENLSKTAKLTVQNDQKKLLVRKRISCAIEEKIAILTKPTNINFFFDLSQPIYKFDLPRPKTFYSTIFSCLFASTDHFSNLISRNHSIYLYFNIFEIRWTNQIRKAKNEPGLLSETKKFSDAEAESISNDNFNSHQQDSDIKNLICLVLEISSDKKQSDFIKSEFKNSICFFLIMRNLCKWQQDLLLDTKYCSLFKTAFLNFNSIIKTENDQAILKMRRRFPEDMKVIYLQFGELQAHKIPRRILIPGRKFKLKTFKTLKSFRFEQNVFKYEDGRISRICESKVRGDLYSTLDEIEEKAYMLFDCAVYELNE